MVQLSTRLNKLTANRKQLFPRRLYMATLNCSQRFIRRDSPTAERLELKLNVLRCRYNQTPQNSQSEQMVMYLLMKGAGILAKSCYSSFPHELDLPSNPLLS
jgi:hypothetical protein